LRLRILTSYRVFFLRSARLPEAAIAIGGAALLARLVYLPRLSASFECEDHAETGDEADGKMAVKVV
jgi:hypothetical protein